MFSTPLLRRSEKNTGYANVDDLLSYPAITKTIIISG